MKVKVLENLCELLGGCRMIYSFELWGLEGGWQETDKNHSRFCKQVLKMPRCGADRVTELELAAGSGTGNMQHRIAKHWLYFFCTWKHRT